MVNLGNTALGGYQHSQGLAPIVKVADGHIVKCHLTDADLDEMEPVIPMAG